MCAIKLSTLLAAAALLLVIVVVQPNSAQSGANELASQVCRVNPRANTEACVNCCARFGLFQRPCKLFGNCVCTSDQSYSSAASLAAIERAKSGQSS